MRVPCPTCKREIAWSADNPWRPFCTERCRLVDLGLWLNEGHAIPGDLLPSSEDDNPDA